MPADEIFAKRLRRVLDQGLETLVFVENINICSALKSLIDTVKKSLAIFEGMLLKKNNPMIAKQIPLRRQSLAKEFKEGFVLIDLNNINENEQQLIKTIGSDIEVILDLPTELSLADLQYEANELLFDSNLQGLGDALKQLAIKGPSCFISYAWGNTVVEKIVHRLAERLVAAGINVVLDIWHNRTNSIVKFTERTKQEDFVLVMGSQLLRQKYDNPGPFGSYVHEELRMIASRVKEHPGQHGVIKVLIENPFHSAFPEFLVDNPHAEADFTKQQDYYERFFSLLSLLYVDNETVLTLLHDTHATFLTESSLLMKKTIEQLKQYLIQAEPTAEAQAAAEQALHEKLQNASQKQKNSRTPFWVPDATAATSSSSPIFDQASSSTSVFQLGHG